jgi:hypothetical protein
MRVPSVIFPLGEVNLTLSGHRWDEKVDPRSRMRLQLAPFLIRRPAVSLDLKTNLKSGGGAWTRTTDLRIMRGLKLGADCSVSM